MRSRRLLALLGLLFTAHAAGDDQSLYTLHVFTVDKADGERRLAQPIDDAALHQQLMDLVKTQPATLEKLIIVSAVDGVRATVTLADELRYPTEFDPQQMPQQVVIGDGAMLQALQTMLKPEPPAPATPTPPPAAPSMKPASDKPAPDHPVPQPATPRHPINNGLALITAITPTAFEMRNLGDTLEIDTSADGPTSPSDAMVSYAITAHQGFQQVNGEMLPHFSNREIITSVALQRDRPRFLGTCAAPQRTGTALEDNGATLSFAFLTKRTTKLKNPPLKPSKPNAPDYPTMLEVFSLSKADANALIEERLPERDVHARVQSQLKSGQARLETFLCGNATNNSTTLLEEVQDYRYPLEYDPPQCPRSLFLADARLLAGLREGHQTGTALAPSSDASPNNGGFGLMTHATPTKFENRPLGTQLELDLSSNGLLFHLRAIKVQLTRLIGQRDYNGTQQPVIESQTLMTTTTAQPGVPHLLGTLSRPINTGIKEGNQEDRVWLAFLTIGR